MLIKLVSPQASLLSFHFIIGKMVMLHLLEGPVKGNITEDRKINKAKHLMGIEPTISLLQDVH